MRFLLRAIIFGILTGAAIFFFSFHFFFFPILFAFLLMRIFFRPWRWRHRYNGFGPHRAYSRFAGQRSGAGDADGFAPVIPIDGFGWRGNAGNQKDKRDIDIQ